MSSRSSDSSTHSQDADGRTPAISIRGIGAYSKPLPPPPPVISQFGPAYVGQPLPSPSTPQRKRELESSPPSQSSNYTPEEKRQRKRQSLSPPRYSRRHSHESTRSSSTSVAGDDSEEIIISEPKKIKDFRKLVEDQTKERKDFDERHQNEVMTAITTSAQEIMHLNNENRKQGDRIIYLEEKVRNLKVDKRKGEDQLKKKKGEHWQLNVVFEATNKELNELKERYEQYKNDISALETIILQLQAEKVRLEGKNETFWNQKDEAIKKQKDSEKNLDVARKEIERLQVQLKIENIAFNRTKVDLVESQKKVEECKQDAKVANEKVAKLEQKLSEALRSDNKGKEDLVKIAAEFEKLTEENTDLESSLKLQSTENDMLKESLAKLQETNAKLSAEVAQNDKNMNAFVAGFMEKVEEVETSSRSNIQSWIRTAKQGLNKCDADIPEEENSKTSTPKLKRSEELREDVDLIYIMNTIMGSLNNGNPEMMGTGQIRTVCPNATEEIPRIISGTPRRSSSVDMEPVYQSPPQVDNASASSPSVSSINQRDIKTSPSPMTSRGPVAVRPGAGVPQVRDFSHSLSPTPQNKTTVIGSKLPAVSPNYSPNEQCVCPWCEHVFPSKLAMAKHVCENPRDPRMAKQQQKKMQ